MSISHELSSEIATALFAAKERSPRELKDLKDMVFQIHSTLEQLTESARADRVTSQSTRSKATDEHRAAAVGLPEA